MIKNKYIVLGTAVFLLIFATIYTYNSFLFIKPYNSNTKSIGIIDGALSTTYNNITLNDNSNLADSKTHGDDLISFLDNYSHNTNVYYFNASNKNGIVDTSTLIEGLNWMKANNISKINVSMSSKIYSEKLENWIDSNKDNIQVYASYNNLSNTRDYPAMYENVIATGVSKDTNFKDIDVQYRNSNIILRSQLFNIYKGNSYLSLVTVLNN